MTVGVYYINLATRPEREAFMEQQLQRLGIHGTRVEAATPAELSAEQLENCEPRKDGGPSPSSFCCSLSHLKTMERFEAGPHSHALILEDDAVLSSELAPFLAAFQRSPIDGVVRIETGQRGIRFRGTPISLGPVSISRPLSWEGGSAGYMISRRAALEVRSHIDLTLGYDEALFNPFGRLRSELRLFQTVPALVVQAHLRPSSKYPNFERDIVSAAARQHEHWTKHLRRNLRSIYHREIIYGSQRTLQQLMGARKQVIPFAE